MTPHPLIPAQAGAQIVRRHGWKVRADRGFKALDAELCHLGPGVRRDERNFEGPRL